ncbi:MAG TPA: hypothetical protein VG206_15285 [Terriglobia bacterium]|nr:hypothetical protein [Terriglobia bacterium]
MKALQASKKVLLPAALMFCLAPLTARRSAAQDVPVQRNPIVTQDVKHVTTGLAFRDMAPVPWHNQSKVMPEHDRSINPHVSNEPDSVTQTLLLPEVSTTAGLSFDGLDDAQGGGFVPPDTNASVGDTQVVETVNVAYAVYNKSTGALELGPVNIQTLYSPLGGQCATGNLSDPTAIYDKAAARWVITMIAFNNSFSQNDACIAVSTSSDATGSYNLYAFSYGTTLPDYPKLGAWPDAYYLTTDSFPNGGFFTGAETCALDRTNMLAGNTATAICFQRGTSDFALLPADLDGATAPPSGSPNYQMELGTSTKLNLFKFHVDFVTPTNSTFTGPTPLTVPSYTDACASTGDCVVQPSPGEKLDSLGDRLMFRLAYRNFGTFESLVANHSVKPSGSGAAVSGVRWYEVRSPGSSPVIFQKGTVGGGTSSVGKWMGSIAEDKNGDIALGYSKSNSSTKPSIEYVGRVPTDALGTMESAKLVATGTGVQTNSSHRWGDYSSMAIDPSDDCTFWYAQEYYKTTGSFNFSTHLNSFRFNTCP